MGRHLEAAQATMRPGDLLCFDRGLYSHWAVYIGTGLEGSAVLSDSLVGSDCQWRPLARILEARPDVHFVVHLWQKDGGDIGLVSGEGGDWRVFLSTLDEVLESGEKFWVDNGLDGMHKPFDGEEVVRRALSKIGGGGYNLVWRNCEHFVSWARYGKAVSDQVRGCARGIVRWGLAIRTMWRAVRGCRPFAGGLGLGLGARRRAVSTMAPGAMAMTVYAPIAGHCFSRFINALIHCASSRKFNAMTGSPGVMIGHVLIAGGSHKRLEAAVAHKFKSGKAVMDSISETLAHHQHATSGVVGRLGRLSVDSKRDEGASTLEAVLNSPLRLLDLAA